MDGSIASQLKAIKSQLRGSDDPVRRPITRPSVLFDPKEAADLDLRTILPIAISGLDVLAGVDGRFERYKDTLFSNTSLDIDREKMAPKEEEKINKSIFSYLRLLSGHLQLAAALKTLEYLVRRYQVHVFNIDELILCALPYHDTHAFVRIVQLINFRNNKWGFLEATRVSGAPPTRKVLVQQCIRDKGVLEAICNYALPTKESEPSRQVMCFCTALVVEMLGSVQKLDDDTVKRVLPFVFNGLNPAIKRSQDAKAGALMVAGLLSSRATLSAKLTNSLIFFIARVAHEDAKESHDLPWLRVTLMAIITIIQSQSVHTLPKKSLMIIADIRDLAGILCGLLEDFNIEKFLALYIHTLVDYSSSDKTCHSALISALEVIPVRKMVGNIVTKVLESCLKTSKNMEESDLHEAGSWATQIFTVISKNYDCEMRAATQTFFQNSKTFSMEDESMLRSLCLMFDRGTNITGLRACNSKLWLSLQHPKASVRQATLSHIFSSDMLQSVSVDPQLLVIVEDTVIRQLHDRDLAVVQETLSIEGLSELISHSVLLKAFEDVLLRCIDVLKNSASYSKAPFEVAESCLGAAIKFCHPTDVSKMLFPLLLLLPKTWKLNLRALELARASQWPFYHDSLTSFDIDMDDSARIFEDGFITSFNLKIIGDMADTFAENPAENIEWLTECSKDSDPSKSLFLFIIQQAVFNHKGDINGLVKLFEVCFPILEHEWQDVTSKGNISITEEITAEKLNNSSLECLNQLLNLNVKALNANIIVSVCWAFLKAFASKAASKAFDDCKRNNMLESLFIFFASSPLQNIFRAHLLFLTSECCNSSVEFLSRFFTNGGFSIDVQIESLRSLACLSSTSDRSATDVTHSNKSLQLLVEFPSILVPLASKTKDIRAAAMNCIETLYNLWRNFDSSSVKNGNDTKLIQYVCAPIFGELLQMIYDQKKLIISDVGFLPSLLTSMLGFSNSLVVPHNIENRFNRQAKDTILIFILRSVMRLSSYAKLMVLSLVKGIGNSIFKIEQVDFLFHDLIERRSISHVKPSEPYKKLTEMDIELLCVLVEISTIGTSSVDAGSHYLDHQIKTLQVDGASLEDPAITRPCVATLQSLTNVLYQKLKSETQDIVFGHLVLLFRNDNGNIQIAAKEALLRINVNCSSVVNILELILSASHDTDSCKRMRREKLQEHLLRFSSVFYDVEKTLSFLNSLLDILMLKKDIKNRKSLVNPLFHLLKDLFCNGWVQNNCDRNKEGVEVSIGFSQTITDAKACAEQGILMILEDVTVSLLSDYSDPSIDMHTTSKVKLLVECAHSTEDTVTRNHIFSLLSAFAKISSEWISECTVDLLSVIGEATIKQNDSQSQHVLENLITAIVPRWLSMANGTKNLLEVFINVLPQVGVNRRLSLMVYLLRTLSEKNSLGILIALLFRSLALRKKNFSDYEDITDDITCTDKIRGQWEYLFALEIFNQFPCNIWLSSLINLIEEIRSDDQHEHHSEFLLVLHFIMQKLHSTELAFELESGQDTTHLQIILGGLLEKIVLKLQSGQLKRTIHSCLRRHLKELGLGILKTVTSIMVPSEFYECITRLLEHGDVHVSKKTLGFLCETLKIVKLSSTKHTQKLNQLGSKRHYVDERTSESFSKMCFKLIQLIDCSDDNLSSAKLAAISCIETLVKEFPSNDQICRSSLTVVAKHIMSKDIYLASGCLKCMCALINILCSKALPELPDLIKNVLERAKCIPDYPAEEQKVGRRKKRGSTSSCRLLLPLNILMVLESFIEHLGLFLNPYLEDIIKLLILQNEYVSGSDPRIKSTAAVIRKLIVEKIPVRLTLPQLFKVYPKALDSGDESLLLAFDMLATATSAMDRSAIGSYYSKIFEHCLMALDLRRQHPQSLKNINTVEQNVLRVIVVLTLKLTESMFRPIFLQSLEWVESELIVNDSTSRSTERAISFFNLVNMLAEHQRSLFVPYFKYLVDGCTCYLTEDPKMNIAPLSKKRKKAIAGEEGKLQAKQLSLDQWHLRALILTSLYKCFLYDTGNYKFLDSTNFQILLKPIVSQLVLEPIILPEDSLDVPGVEEVDESLVCCLGQMAITVGSDDIWKQLNHEVLMQTRSEQTRARILGLRVIKYLVQHLKEEYVVALPETIPFLGELLEDVELPVRSLAQEIFKELETLTGESLRKYL